MINKIFKNKGSGSAKASLNYLLDKEEGKVRVLSGDPELSMKIAENLEFKNRYTVGCLSFSEKDLDEKVKLEIMEKFEDSFFAGLDKDQYNITWIEHTDKGRLELNYFIPNVEMKSGKRLQPYYDKIDRRLSDSFCSVINHEYGLSDSHNPELQQLTAQPNLSEIKDKKILIESINKAVENGVKQGFLEDRKGIILFLEKSGLKVARNSKTLSIEDPNGGKNIRLKGALYEQDFRVDEEYREKLSGRIEEYQSTSEERYRRNQEELQREVEKRAGYNRGRYRRNDIEHSKGAEKRRESNDFDLGKKGAGGNFERDFRGFIRDYRGIIDSGGVVQNENREFDGGKKSDGNESGKAWEPEFEVLESRKREKQRDLLSDSREKGGNLQSEKGSISDENQGVNSDGNKYKSGLRRIFERFREFFGGLKGRNRAIEGNESEIERRKRAIERRERDVGVQIEGIGENVRGIGNNNEQLARAVKKLRNEQDRGFSR